MTLETIQTELIYHRPEGRTTGAAIVPVDSLEHLEAIRVRRQITTQWLYETDPQTGERRPAFTPIAGNRLTLIESQGIQSGDRFLATFDVKEVMRNGNNQRQWWLVNAQPMPQS